MSRGERKYIGARILTHFFFKEIEKTLLIHDAFSVQLGESKEMGFLFRGCLWGGNTGMLKNKIGKGGGNGLRYHRSCIE